MFFTKIKYSSIYYTTQTGFIGISEIEQKDISIPKIFIGLIQPVCAINKLSILKEKGIFSLFLKGRSGIYCWYNKINENIYVGSAKNLNNRILDYSQPHYLKTKNNTLIVKALLKYGIDNFTLYILEWTDSDKKSLLENEQKDINLLNPIYNIAKIAGSTQGIVHTPENKEKMRLLAIGRKHSYETRKLMSINRVGELNPFFGKTHSEKNLAVLKISASQRTKDSNPGHQVSLVDIKIPGDENITFKSVREASKFLKVTPKKIMNHDNYIINNKYLVKVLMNMLSPNLRNKGVKGLPPTEISTLIPVILFDVLLHKSLPFKSVSAAGRFLDLSNIQIKKNKNKIIQDRYYIFILKTYNNN